MTNWQDNSRLFRNFDEQKTKLWMQEGFTKEQTREWLKEEIEDDVDAVSAYAAFLINEKNLTPNHYQRLNYNKKSKLENEFGQWIEQFAWCDSCWKRIRKEDFYFADWDNDLGTCSKECQDEWEKANTKFIFTEESFKDYLRTNAAKDWFAEMTDSWVWYRNRTGNHNLNSYKGKYVTDIRDVLIDPSITIDEIINMSRQTDNVRMATNAANNHSRFMNTIGMDEDYSVIHHHYHQNSYGNNYQSIETTNYLSQVNTYRENVEFILMPDESKWVIEDVLVDGVSQVAEHICQWSNQVYQEKFAVKQIEVKKADQQLEKLVDNLENKLNISSIDINEIKKTITRKEKELSRKEKIFNLHLEKGNEEGIERKEKEIANLEEEIDQLKSQLTASETNFIQYQS